MDNEKKDVVVTAQDDAKSYGFKNGVKFEKEPANPFPSGAEDDYIQQTNFVGTGSVAYEKPMSEVDIENNKIAEQTPSSIVNEPVASEEKEPTPKFFANKEGSAEQVPSVEIVPEGENLQDKVNNQIRMDSIRRDIETMKEKISATDKGNSVPDYYTSGIADPSEFTETVTEPSTYTYDNPEEAEEKARELESEGFTKVASEETTEDSEEEHKMHM